MYATQRVHIPLSSSLIPHAKKAHIFDRLHSASLISLCKLFDDDCINILDKIGIIIIKDSKLIFIGHQKNQMDYGTYPYIIHWYTDHIKL